MTRPIKIGILCPYSSIYPNLSNDFIDGLQSGLPTGYINQIQFFPEYIGQGGRVAITEPFNKLMAFHNVDLITGFVSYQIIPDFVKNIEDRNKIAFFADMGEYLPFTQHISDNIFFNSLQSWQGEYALGHWAHREFGGKGVMCMSLYEAGYQMHMAFQKGNAMAGAQELDVSVIPLNRADRAVMNQYLDDFIEKFRKERPSFVHVLFSGHEAIDFIGLYYERGLDKEIPLIVSPHMASEEILLGLKNINTSFYTASMWNGEIDTVENAKFKNVVLQKTGLLTNTPTLLGYEIGLALTNVFGKLQRRDIAGVTAMLKQQRITTPRGERSFYLDSEYSTPVIDIEKVRMEKGGLRKMVIEQGRAMQYDSYVFDEIHRENISGWLNPYLCI